MLPRTTTLRIRNILSTTADRKYTLEEPKTKSAAGFQHSPRKHSSELTKLCSSGILSAFGQAGKICNICCSTLGFLLHFLKIITTAVIYVTTFTDSYLSRQTTYDATQAERPTTASRSSRKCPTLYLPCTHGTPEFTVNTSEGRSVFNDW